MLKKLENSAGICYFTFLEGIVKAINPATNKGSENKVKIVVIGIPLSLKIPNNCGPKIAPKRPMPKAKPTPVERIAAGYIRVAVGKNALKPPCTKKPIPNIRANIKAKSNFRLA